MDSLFRSEKHRHDDSEADGDNRLLLRQRTQQIRGKDAEIECGKTRMVLLGIWDRGGLQIHPGE